jgi:pyruvate carboxylase
VKKELEGKIARECAMSDVLSYLLYPQVFMDYQKHLRAIRQHVGAADAAFFYGLQSGEEINVEIEPGKTLILKYLTTGEPREDGTRTVFFELNGQPREVSVPDRSGGDGASRIPRPMPDNPKHIAAPMPGKVSTVSVNKGESV